ncbi:unnamed protein product [Auanema sp. JU1783]|nr:unnamed protein product [Auanema sp. JU1783]
MSVNRLSQYKNGSRKSSLMKDVLMKKCIEKMKDTRRNLHNSRRNIGKIEEEEASNAINLVIAEEMDNFSTDEKIAMFEELKNDLVMLEYEQFLNEVQNAGDEGLLAHLEEDVFCPNCTVYPLDVDHTGMLCRNCNFAHPAFIQITKSELGERFRKAFSDHSDRCENQLMPIAEGSKLGIRCRACPYFSEIL